MGLSCLVRITPRVTLTRQTDCNQQQHLLLREMCGRTLPTPKQTSHETPRCTSSITDTQDQVRDDRGRVSATLTTHHLNLERRSRRARCVKKHARNHFNSPLSEPGLTQIKGQERLRRAPTPNPRCACEADTTVRKGSQRFAKVRNKVRRTYDVRTTYVRISKIWDAPPVFTG